MEPVFAALAAYLWGQETLTWRQGAGCLLAGMILAEIKDNTNLQLDKFLND
ncbi:hypothetical protein MGLY_29030 [Neomoorella glycerini]|uniref:EamA domain-containing protein n=2 Tax=Neomoorella glycerini TaxID=55779 RepID=A0A6I5ZTU3_9FIRM|nr:hypothetical protein MGLY_29030 [Moorella glycerini]